MILGLDTTTAFLHLALLRGAACWTRRLEAGVGKSHSAVLLPGLSSLLAEAGAAPSDLTGVAVCVGPGGFTSLRIGVATAEGLGLAGLPTWGFSAFELRARTLRAGGFQAPAWILLDGQRGEAFVQPWGPEGAEAEAARHPLEALSERLGSRAWWAPSPFRERAEAALGRPPLPLADEAGPTLAALAELCRLLPQRPPEARRVPFSLRETDAEVNFPEASAHLPEALRRGHAR